MENHKLEINPGLIFRVLSATIAVIIVLSVATVVADNLAGHNSMIAHKLMKLFYVELEDNVPAFFSTIQLAAASGALLVVAILKRRARDKYSAEWMLLTVGFMAMAFDELVAVHERLIEPMRELLGSGQLGIFYFAWVIPMGILVLLVGTLLFGFWWNLPLKTKIQFMIAGLIFLGGAVGCELIESKHSEIYGRDTFFYIFLTTLEEALEMFAIAYFIKVLLSYAYETFGSVELKLAGAHVAVDAPATGTIAKTI